MNKYAKNLIFEIENKYADVFASIDDIALYNQEKVLNAFATNHISTLNFYPSTGYGYDDMGRIGLCNVFASIFNTDKAIVSPLIMSGTHAISIALAGLLTSGDTVLCPIDKPYDTLYSVINSDNQLSLKNSGVKFDYIPYSEDVDYDTFAQKLLKKPTMVYIQRSRGYAWRGALSIEKIAKIFDFTRKISPNSIIFVDNCYGEFMEKLEPTDVGADVIAGSLIKNPGGGIAPTGGYIAGKESLIDRISYRYSAPSLGMEIGSYSAGYREFYQGIFVAPHVSAGALKGAFLVARTLEQFGFETLPRISDTLDDIVCTIKLNTKEQLLAFCKAVQSTSPVEAYVTPVPNDMPGYDNQVIMAAGTFVQGSSIELSADAPILEPYIVYMQGGLTYEHIKIALANILESLKLV